MSNPLFCLQMPRDSSGHWAFSAFHSMMTTVVLQHQRFNNYFINCQIILLVFYERSVTSLFPATTYPHHSVSCCHIHMCCPFLHDPCYQFSPSMTTGWGTVMTEVNEQSCQHSKHGHKVIQY